MNTDQDTLLAESLAYRETLELVISVLPPTDALRVFVQQVLDAPNTRGEKLLTVLKAAQAFRDVAIKPVTPFVRLLGNRSLEEQQALTTLSQSLQDLNS